MKCPWTTSNTDSTTTTVSTTTATSMGTAATTTTLGTWTTSSPSSTTTTISTPCFFRLPSALSWNYLFGGNKCLLPLLHLDLHFLWCVQLSDFHDGGCFTEVSKASIQEKQIQVLYWAKLIWCPLIFQVVGWVNDLVVVKLTFQFANSCRQLILSSPCWASNRPKPNYQLNRILYFFFESLII